MGSKSLVVEDTSSSREPQGIPRNKVNLTITVKGTQIIVLPGLIKAAVHHSELQLAGRINK